MSPAETVSFGYRGHTRDEGGRGRGGEEGRSRPEEATECDEGGGLGEVPLSLWRDGVWVVVPRGTGVRGGRGRGGRRVGVGGGEGVEDGVGTVDIVVSPSIDLRMTRNESIEHHLRVL
jgi:hypothetical protein